MHSIDYTYSASQKHDHLEDMEHKRVIDNFVVRRKEKYFSKIKFNFLGLSFSS
jgi:hypothetical protein